MNLGVQYYRPPFPETKYWEDDFKRIKDSGLNTVQLWVIWAWVEAKPGHFDFDDYDRLVSEGRGRRVFPAQPDHSLLLMKPSGRVVRRLSARTASARSLPDMTC